MGKETILSSPTKTKLTFTNSSNLQYDIVCPKIHIFLGFIYISIKYQRSRN